MNTVRIVLILSLLCLMQSGASAVGFASKIIDNVAAKFAGKDVICGFTVSAEGQSLNGELSVSGRKFKLVTPRSTTWFNGKEMWVSNSDTREITLVEPTSEEISESNPFEYLNSYKRDYNVYMSRNKDDACHVILLNPKNKSGQIRAVEIAVNKKTLLPEQFRIRDASNHITVIKVTSLKTGVKLPSNGFSCPVGQMTDYELIDLR